MLSLGITLGSAVGIISIFTFIARCLRKNKTKDFDIKNINLLLININSAIIAVEKFDDDLKSNNDAIFDLGSIILSLVGPMADPVANQTDIYSLALIKVNKFFDDFWFRFKYYEGKEDFSHDFLSVCKQSKEELEKLISKKQKN